MESEDGTKDLSSASAQNGIMFSYGSTSSLPTLQPSVDQRTVYLSGTLEALTELFKLRSVRDTMAAKKQPQRLDIHQVSLDVSIDTWKSVSR